MAKMACWVGCCVVSCGINSETRRQVMHAAAAAAARHVAAAHSVVNLFPQLTLQ
jgi:hypothetical protein